MNCNACGTPIPDGAANCPNCGQAVMNMGFSQPANQPQINPQNPMGQQPYGQPQGQPQMGYQQPYGQPQFYQQQSSFNKAELVKFANSGYIKLISIISALLLYHSPLLAWYALGHGDSRYACGLLQMGAKSYMDAPLMIVYGVAMMLVAAIIIVSDLADYIPTLKNVKQSIPYMEIILTSLLGVVFIFWFLAFFNGDLLDALDYSSKATHGTGPVFAMIGIVINAAVRVISLVAGKR